MLLNVAAFRFCMSAISPLRSERYVTTQFSMEELRLTLEMSNADALPRAFRYDGRYQRLSSLGFRVASER